MSPILAVGRWQRNKDLSWYAKGDDSQEAQDAAKARLEEIRRIKEAEQDALSAALGFAVEQRIRDSQLAGAKDVEKAIKDTAEGDEEDGVKGVGYGAYVGTKGAQDTRERMMGYIDQRGGLEGGASRKKKRGEDTSRDKDRVSKKRHDRDREDRHRSHRHHHGHHRSRSRSRERTTRRRSRSPSYERRRDNGYLSRKHRERSYSPDPRRRDRHRD